MLTETTMAAALSDPEAALAELDREDASGPGGLARFIKSAWHILEPATEYRHNWHIDAVCEHLEAVSAGEIRWLIINIPPRAMKSLTVSVCWPVWDWLENPHLRWIFASYAQNLSTRDNVKARRLIQSSWFSMRWGDRFSLVSDQNAKEYYENDKRGFRLATSVDGLATGEGGHRQVIDDPHNIKEAESDAKREGTLTWLDEVMPTRFNDPKTGARVLVMQRTHDRDCSGHLLREGGYDHLCYDGETEVLTHSGWIRFDALKRGVEVAQVDPATLVMSFVAPTAYVDKAYKGVMLKWHSACIDLLVTPEHRMVYKSEAAFGADREGPWHVRSAVEMPGTFYIPQAAKWEASDVDTVDLAGSEVSGDDYCRFMGMWLAEGCTILYKSKKHRDGVYRSTVISQDGGETCDKIEELLDRLPFKFNKQRQLPREHHFHFTFYSRDLWEALRPFGKSGDKYVPAVVKGMSARQIDLFLEWYGMGDGHRPRRNPTQTHYVSKSRRMIDDVQELMLRIGQCGGLQVRPPAFRIQNRIVASNRGGRVVKRGGEFKNYGKLSVKAHRTEEDFDGHVYCVSVPNGALVVRRNGKTAVSGNCLPMRFEASRLVPTGSGGKPNPLFVPPTTIGFQDPREEEGELLWPDHFDETETSRIETSLGPYATAGQFQQRPTPRGGGMIDTDKIIVLDEVPDGIQLQLARSWDYAATDPKKQRSLTDPDWTVGALCGVSYDQMAQAYDDASDGEAAVDFDFYILHVARFRKDPGERDENVKRIAKADGTGVIVWIEQEPGASGKSVIVSARAMLPGHSVNPPRPDPMPTAPGGKRRVREAGTPSGNKVQRAEPFSTHVWRGRVYIIAGEWNHEYLEELGQFPLGSKDDQVDATSQAFLRLTERPLSVAELMMRQGYYGR